MHLAAYSCSLRRGPGAGLPARRASVCGPLLGAAMPRSRRLTALSQLLAERRFTSQDELARALAREGHPVTQATLSRDLRSLGAGKRPDPHGRTVYDLPAPA